MFERDCHWDNQQRWRDDRNTTTQFNASPINVRIAWFGKKAVSVCACTAAEDLGSWATPSASNVRNRLSLGNDAKNDAQDRYGTEQILTRHPTVGLSQSGSIDINPHARIHRTME
jgi:hypothetical protein